MESDPVLTALVTLHAGLPRKGPGSDALTREIIDFLRPRLPPHPHVTDMGCGAGQAALTLAESLDAHVTAVDLSADFIDELRDRISGLSGGYVEPRVECMLDAELEPGTVDLIWCEGAAYTVGVETALDAWRPLMVPGGLLVLSDCCWFTATPPEAAKTFWASHYPKMGSQGDLLKRLEAKNWSPLLLRRLPSDAWWETYYTPLIDRMAALEGTGGPALDTVIAMSRAEMDLFRAHSAHYGYALVVAQAPPG